MKHVHICNVLTVKRRGAIFVDSGRETNPQRFVVSGTVKEKRADPFYFSCPMYFTAIEEVDQSWSENEYQCLEKFHRIRSLKYLRQAYDQLGADLFQQLDEQFDIIKTCVVLH